MESTGGEGQKCEGLSFDSNVPPDPEAVVTRSISIYKDGAVFPRPGLAEVPHVQHMGTMNESWAPASPPSGMAMVGQPGGGPTKHLSGLGA